MRKQQFRNKGGRPQLYNQSYVDKAIEYIDSCVDKPYKVGNKVMWTVNIPTIEGLAYRLKVHKETLYDWGSKFPEFSDVLSDLRNIQAEKLQNKGLSGDYNPIISKLLLAKHGYRDGIDVNNNNNVVDTEEKEKSDKALDEYIGFITPKKKK